MVKNNSMIIQVFFSKIFGGGMSNNVSKKPNKDSSVVKTGGVEGVESASVFCESAVHYR